MCGKAMLFRKAVNDFLRLRRRFEIMSKENLLFAIIGLMVGAIAGFMFANSVNKSTITTTPVAANTSVAGPLSGNNPALPANHPPLGTSSGDAAGQTQSGSVPEVSAAIEKARTEPQNYQAQMTAADLYYQIQRFDEAAKLYENAVKLKPTETEPLIKLGNALFDAEKYTEAEKWYALALEKDPKNIIVRTDLGLTFFLREPRDLDKAIKEFERSLALDPNHEVTLQNIALAWKEKGDPEKLRQAIAKLKSVNPNNPALASLEGK